MSISSDFYLGASATWIKVQDEIEPLARSSLPLVLLGPTGSGKSMLAAQVHAISGRLGSLVEHTIGSVPDALSYSAFLGHNRGAYTGAVDRHSGLLESTKGGTLFLDEMGLASGDVQHLLLGLMEGRPFTPLGASRPVRVDVRFVFATNAEPEALLAQGKWQADFYYRLGGNFVRLPGLAERRVDILPLANLFLKRRLGSLGREWHPQLSVEVQAIFMAHPWPGNIRQLQSICDRIAVLMQTERPAQITDLTPEFLRELRPSPQANAPDAVATRVHEVLGRHQGNKAAAARELGMHRTDLYRFLERNPRPSPSGGFARPA